MDRFIVLFDAERCYRIRVPQEATCVRRVPWLVDMEAIQSAYFCKQRRLMPKENRQMVLWLAIGRIKMHIHKLTDKGLKAKRHCAACGKLKLHNLEFLAKPHQSASMVHV